MNSPLQLRPYQKEAVAAAIEAFKRNENALIVAATGAGKSLIMAELAKRCAETYKIKVLVLMHRLTLVEQNKKTFEVHGASAKISTIQTVARRDLDHVHLVIIDEAHRLPPRNKNSQYTDTLAALLEMNPRLRICGLTATPYRLGTGYIYGKESDWFKEPCYEIGTKQLQDEGFLAPIKYFVAGSPDLSSISTTGGDYNEGQLENELTKEMHLMSVKHAIPDDRNATAIFCVTIAHSEMMASAVGGVPVHSQLSMDERKVRLDHFAENGGIICSVMALTEGWDAKNCDCVVLARPTMSPALFVQSVGRGLRTHPNKKDCLVLDMVGCYNRHGSPLDPTVSEKAGGEAKEFLRRENVCPECGFITEGPICPECGINIQEFNAQDGVEYLNKPIPVKEVNLDGHLVSSISASLYTARSGSECVKIIYMDSTGFIMATDYFALRSDKATPKRKFRKMAKALYGIDLGAQFSEAEAIQIFQKQPNGRIQIEKDGKYKNAKW